MILIGENINIVSQSIGVAIRQREAQPIRELTSRISAMDYLDLNIGPAKKDGPEVISWLIDQVRSVSSLPLCLDTTNPQALLSGLEKLPGEPVLINSISLQAERLEKILPLASQSRVDVIGLLWGESGMPRDLNERCMLAVELLLKTSQAGIPNHRVWIDPIATPVSGDISQILSTIEFMQILEDIAPGCKSVVGLSNVSNGAPAALRHYLNAVYLIMLKRYGLYAAIVDGLDSELLAISRGERPDLEKMVHQVMDREQPIVESGSTMEKYYKTALVLNGRSIFSNAWLD